MGLLDMFDKLDDIIYAPVKAVSSWLEEPLRHMEHTREKDSAKQAAELEVWRAQKQEELRQAAGRADLDLQKLADDAQFSRNKAAVEAIKQYQTDLAHVAGAMIENIARMNLALRDQAREMTYSYTDRYRAQQSQAIRDVINQVKEVETLFPDNEPLRQQMTTELMTQMAPIISSANKFINDMNEDLNKINALMDNLTMKAQENTEKIIQTLPTGTAKEALISGANPALPAGK